MYAVALVCGLGPWHALDLLKATKHTRIEGNALSEQCCKNAFSLGARPSRAHFILFLAHLPIPCRSSFSTPALSHHQLLPLIIPQLEFHYLPHPFPSPISFHHLPPRPQPSIHYSFPAAREEILSNLIGIPRSIVALVRCGTRALHIWHTEKDVQLLHP